MNTVIADVLEAVRAEVATLGLTLAGALLPVVTRKLPVKEEGIDPPSQIVVSLADALPQPTRFAQGVLLYTLPVEVTLVSPSDGNLADVGDLSNLFGLVRDHFAQQGLVLTLSGSTSNFYDLRPAEGAFLDRARLSARYQYQSQRVTVRVLTFAR